jgi:hypothetical protein
MQPAIAAPLAEFSLPRITLYSPVLSVSSTLAFNAATNLAQWCFH